jgi:hypothetical protein
MVATKNLGRIPRKTRFLKKAGFPDLSAKNFSHIQRLCWHSSARYQPCLTATRSQKETKFLTLIINPPRQICPSEVPMRTHRIVDTRWSAFLTVRGDFPMDPKELAAWIDAKICGPCHQGYTCDDFDCSRAKEVAEILKRMAPFKGKDSSGHDVTGWFVPEQRAESSARGMAAFSPHC